MSLSLILPAIISTISSAITKAIPDKDKAAELQAQITSQILSQQNNELEGAIKIILAEAQGESWLQRNWRPLLMLVIIAIVANNYLFAPYVNALFGAGSVPMLELPEQLWNLMTLGVGGYIAGRTGEKMIETWKAK